MRILLALVALIAMRRLAGWALVLHRMLRMRVRRPRYRVVTEETVPAAARGSFDTPARQLEALGFERAGWMAMDREGADDATSYGAVLFHPTALAYAIIGFARAPEPEWPWSVTFSTYSSGARIFRSVEEPSSSLGTAPGVTEVVSRQPGLADRWQAHREATVDVIATAPGLEAAIASTNTRQRASFDSLVEDGRLFAAERGAYGLSWRQAIRATRAALESTRRLQALRKKRPRFSVTEPRPLDLVPIEAEVAAYRRASDAASGPPRTTFLAAVFAVTVPIFVAASAYWLGNATTGALVFAIVLFHELGHFLAMRALGYVDTTIFFIPFFGGVAAGRKDEATVGQRMITLLAGPLPGLLVAATVAAAGVRLPGNGSLVLVLAVGINLFNLLPILPLDGGQIVHMLFFERTPWLDVAFRALAAAGLLVLSFVTSSVAFGAVAAIMFLQLPRARRLSALRLKLREARAASPGAPADRLFFEIVRETPEARLPFAQKSILARTTLAQAWLDVPVRAGAKIAWLGAYALSIGVGGAAFFFTFAASPGLVPSHRAERRVEADVVLPAVPPAGAGESAPAGNDARYMPAGFGMFASPGALAAGRELLATWAPGEVFRSLGPVVFAWTRVPEGVGNDGDDEDDSQLAGAMKGTQRRVQEAVKAAGGHAYVSPTTTAVLTCDAAGEEAARTVDDAIDEYLTAARYNAPIPGPWDAAQPTEAQKVARRTFHVLTAAPLNAAALKPSLLRLRLQFGMKAGNAEALAWRRTTMEAALAAEREKGPVDEEMARLTIDELRWPGTQPGPALEELRAHLGSCCQAGRPLVFGLETSLEGRRVRVTLEYVLPDTFDGVVVPMQEWLSRQCGEVHFSSRGPRRPATTLRAIDPESGNRTQDSAHAASPALDTDHVSKPRHAV